jgi:hypothetical protein
MNLVSSALRRPISLLTMVVAVALVGFLAIDRMSRDRQCSSKHRRWPSWLSERRKFHWARRRTVCAGADITAITTGTTVMAGESALLLG